MRIAIAAENSAGMASKASHHFGRCPYFILLEIENGEVTAEQIIENPFFASHRPGQVPSFIHEQGVNVIISGHIGRRAMGLFEDFGIKSATGAEGTVDETLKRFLAGELPDAESCCGQDHHGDPTHRCGNHPA